MTAAPARSRSLATRIVGVALLGACLVALVAALLAVPLVRAVARDQSRTELVRAVETLAGSPGISVRLVAQEQRALGPDDRRYALLGRDGTETGDALDYLTDADRAELRRAGTLSVDHRVDGRDYLVEGRAVSRGVLGNRGVFVLGAQPISGVGAATGALVRRLGLALLLGVLVAVAVALVVGRRTADRVRHAADRAHRLAAGDRGLPAPEPARIHEVDEMSTALTALDEALATSEDRQREFLLSVSHELRTPLTALRGYAEALRDGAVGPAEVPEVGATLTEETRRLDAFIADLLALARLEADDFRLQEGTVDVVDLLRTTVAAWQATAQRHGIGLVAEPGADLQPIAGDPLRLRQLLDGLVENALRATPPDGRVTVTATQDADGTTLSVADTGPGLAGGDHERAFERGYLREQYAGQRAVGTGLGLSIAHRLTSRMGGTLTASPGRPGGTVMAVRLDASRLPA